MAGAEAHLRGGGSRPLAAKEQKWLSDDWERGGGFDPEVLERS